MKYPTSVTVVYVDAATQYLRAEVTEVAQVAPPNYAGGLYNLKIERFDLTTEDAARRVARLALQHPELFVEEPPV